MVEDKLDLLHDPIDVADLRGVASRGRPGVDSTGTAPADLDKQTGAINPFADAPHPAVTWSVRRFGFFGLLAAAVVAGFARWIRHTER